MQIFVHGRLPWAEFWGWLAGATRAVLARTRTTERRGSSVGTLSPALQVWAARFRTSDQPTGRSAYRRAVDPAEVQNFAAQNYYATRNVPDQTANTSRSAVAWNRLISPSEQIGLVRRRRAFLSAACAAPRADAPRDVRCQRRESQRGPQRGERSFAILQVSMSDSH